MARGDHASIARQLLAAIKQDENAMSNIDALWELMIDMFLDQDWNGGDAVSWFDERDDEHGGQYDSDDVCGVIGLLEAISIGR